MSNIFSRVYSGAISALSNPLYALITLLIVLFFPLNLVDYLIYIIVNVGVIFLNVIIWILVMIVNMIIWAINEVVISICERISIVFGGDMPCPLDISYWDYTNFTIPYVVVNIFSSSACVLVIILGLLGLSFPIW